MNPQDMNERTPHPRIGRALARYSKDWSARIDLLKKTLDSEALYQRGASAEELSKDRRIQTLEQEAERFAGLSEDYKNYREVSAQEISTISKRLQALEEYVKSKEIDLQNLKSETVAQKLLETERFDKVQEQLKAAASNHDDLDHNVRDLTELIANLKAQSAARREKPEPVPARSAEPAPQPPARSVRAPEPQTPAVYFEPEKSILRKWADWWNEPVTSLSSGNEY